MATAAEQIKATAGPWTIISRSGNPAESFIVGTKTRVTAFVANSDDDSGGAGITMPEDEANARLIAAAPELTERLREIVQAFDYTAQDAMPGMLDGGILHEQADLARALLARIDGKE